MSRIIELNEPVLGRPARVKVTAAPFGIVYPHLTLQTRGRFFWSDVDAILPTPPEGEDQTTEELVEWGIDRMITRTEEHNAKLNDLYQFLSNDEA